MFCPNCGRENDDNAYRCVNCGTVLQQAGGQPPQGQQPPMGQPPQGQPPQGQPPQGQPPQGQPPQGQPPMGQPPMGQPPMGQPPGQMPPPVSSFPGAMMPQATVPNYLVWSILTTIFCCLPAGIVSIVFAAQVNSKLSAGDYAGAVDASNKAKMWAWISFGAGLVIIVIYMILIFAGFANLGGELPGREFR